MMSLHKNGKLFFFVCSNYMFLIVQFHDFGIHFFIIENWLLNNKTLVLITWLLFQRFTQKVQKNDELICHLLDFTVFTTLRMSSQHFCSQWYKTCISWLNDIFQLPCYARFTLFQGPFQSDLRGESEHPGNDCNAGCCYSQDRVCPWPEGHH